MLIINYGFRAIHSWISRMLSAVVGNVHGRFGFRISMLMESSYAELISCEWVTAQVSKSRIKEEQWIININVGACDKLWFPHHWLYSSRISWAAIDSLRGQLGFRISNFGWHVCWATLCVDLSKNIFTYLLGECANLVYYVSTAKIRTTRGLIIHLVTMRPQSRKT